MKLLSDEEEEAVLDFLTNETLALTELISMPPFNEETVKKPHLCPNCGKILSGLTSYRRHLVSKLNPLYFFFEHTLDSGINIGVRLLIFGFFSRGYVLIQESNS